MLVSFIIEKNWHQTSLDRRQCRLPISKEGRVRRETGPGVWTSELHWQIHCGLKRKVHGLLLFRPCAFALSQGAELNLTATPVSQCCLPLHILCTQIATARFFSHPYFSSSGQNFKYKQGTDDKSKIRRANVYLLFSECYVREDYKVTFTTTA